MSTKTLKLPYFSAFSVVIVFAFFSFIGLLISPKLSIQLLPNQTYSSFSISTNLNGASTEVTELELTGPLEGAISRLNGVKKISSISDNGYCEIKVELNKWVDPSSFRIDLLTLIRQLFPKLPITTSYPQVILNSPENNKRYQPLISIAVSSETKDIKDIAQFSEHVIRPLFEDMKGIRKLDITGDQSINQVIKLDLEKITLLHINVADIQDRLQLGLQNMDLGQFINNNKLTLLYLNKEIKSEVDISNFIIGNINGRIYKLKDIATIINEKPRKETISRINGKEKIDILFYADAKINTIDLSKRIKNKIESINFKKSGYYYYIQADQATVIKNELETMYLRAIFSIIILLLFVLLLTRNIRHIIIVLVSLVVNISISFIFYFLFKVDIHVYSVAGISLSLGLVVDNVLVIVEDLRYNQKNRIFAAILASTLTALASLCVVFLLDDNQKILLTDFALAVIINLVISLPIAYYFIPAILNLFPVETSGKREKYKRRKMIVHFNKIFERILTILIRHKKWPIAFTILIFGLPIYLLPLKLKDGNDTIQNLYNTTFGSDWYNRSLREPLNDMLGGITYRYFKRERFFSLITENPDKSSQLVIDMKMPMGANFNQINDLSKDFEKIISIFHEDIKVYTTNIFTPRFARIQIVFKESIDLSTALKLKSIIEEKSMFSGAADFSVYGIGEGFDNGLNADVFDSAISMKGYDFQQLQSLALQVRDSLIRNERVGEVIISSKREWDEISNYIHVARFTKSPYLTLSGVGRLTVGNSLNNITSRWGKVGEYDNKNTTSSVYLSINTNDEPDIWKIKYWSLPLSDSASTKSSSISNINKIKIGNQMIRENQEYILYINYRFIGNHQLNKLMAKQIINSTYPKLPFGYKIEDEISEDPEKSESQSIVFIPLVLLIIYLMCAILLESLKKPFAIIATIPFSYIGVFLIFILLGLQFGSGGYVALFMLSSIATNAALYVTNDLNFIKNKSKNSIRIYIKALNMKAMPIFTTTFSAILSLLPFMILGQETSFWYTMSAGTIGGLFLSWLALYSIFPILLISNNKKY